jgi:phospholipase/carboxylesterase
LDQHDRDSSTTRDAAIAVTVSITATSRPARGTARGALVLLHGRGADEHDLAPVADAFDPDATLAVVLPRGPLALPPGGAHWYALGGLGTPEPVTFSATFPALADWVRSVPSITGVGLDRTIIGGFSQGCVMTYALALAADLPAVAGTIHLSGFLPTVAGFAIDPARGRDCAFFVAHGASDPVIGVEWGRAARDALTSAGALVTYRETPVAHTIAQSTISDAAAWIDALLA